MAQMSVKPKFKITNPAYVVDDSVLVQLCGAMFEIEDPDGDVRALLALLDGSRTATEVESAFRQQRPDSTFDIPAAIAQLDSEGLVEDGAAPTVLDAYELERWKRNLGFFETYATLERNKFTMQERLRDCKVGLLGAGGVGSHVSFDLMGLGVRDLTLVDFDKVELSNLNRQILYTEGDIGNRKVELAVRRLSEYYPGATINGVERMLGSADDVEEIIRDRDFVFCAVDRPKMHVVRWVNDACVRAGVPFIGGGVETQRSVIYLIIPGVTGCMACWQLSAASDERTLAVRAQMEPRHTEGGIGPDLAAFGPMVSALTTLMVTEFVRLIAGVSEPIAAGRLMEMHFADLATRQVEQWQRRADCPVCGENAPVAAT
jgi:molybdopterin/thiamine biosynthesis adenylyltransferase